jgi:hypothetical protein
MDNVSEAGLWGGGRQTWKYYSILKFELISLQVDFKRIDHPRIDFVGVDLARIDLVRAFQKEYFNWWKFPDVRHEEWMVLVRWFSTHIVHNIHVGVRLHQYLDHLRVAIDGCQAKRCVAILCGEKYESNKYRIHYEVQASTWLHTEGHMQARGCVNPVGHSAPHHCVQRPAMQSLCRFQL